ncbi:primosomal protein DnaI [Streptococcus danieliae]|uniref:primosomal protein DnaI n=1 Tax=Streptococcus danieliae TaxID=747656 RepID=UPI0026E94E5D|nr:primosomal protein DnaI [Streptococcus danieliae]
MKSVNNALEGKAQRKMDYQQLVQEIQQDPDVHRFIQEHKLSLEEIQRSISKFSQFISERDRYRKGEEGYLSKGYQPVLIMNQGYADVSYQKTDELIAAEKARELRNRIQLLNLPESLRGISLQDLDLDDRWATIEQLTKFILNYPQDYQGFYLYGDFGIGKTYLLAAFANDLATIKGIQTVMLHFPTFVQDLKDGFKNNTVREQIEEVKGVPCLILDDIGAEQFSSWLRDEVLQVILQYRMQENLPTFFSSNLSFADLQKRMSRGKEGDESWQAQRVMERLRYLAKEIHVPGANRRNQ